MKKANAKQLFALFLALCMVLALCACGASAQAPASSAPAEKAEAESAEAENTETEIADDGSYEIVDMLGRSVTVPAKVERIVALGNTPRMVVYLGLADKVVGYSGMDPEKVGPLTAYAYAMKDTWADVPIVGTDAAGNTDYYPELILTAAPDVILCSSENDMADNIQAQTNIPVVAVAMGTLYGEDYDQALTLIGQVCGVEDRAQAVIRFIDDTLADLQARTAEIPEDAKPTVLSAAATFKGAHGIEGVRPADPVMNAVNAKNVAADAAGGGSAVIVDKEQILGWNPDMIFFDSGGVGLVHEDAKTNPDFYASLKAFQDGNVYQYPSSTSYYSNVEIPLANSYYVGSILYPDAFSDVNMEEKANEIFSFFLGADDYFSVLNESGNGYAPVVLENG